LADDREALTKQIKEANDIVDVVGNYVALRPAGSVFKGLCPFHDDHNPSFQVSPQRQNYRCWSCGKNGDVFQFVQDYEHLGFLEARELLARRAGISLEKTAQSPHAGERAAMLDLTRWSAEQYQQCLLESPVAEAARRYLGERQFTGETVRRFGLGYAPADGRWLVQRAVAAGHSAELLEKLGLIAQRDEGNGYYDRFRDRVLFPIRDVMGRPVGFGGRILPSNPLAERGPKYYNSAESALFTKSEHLYGLDLARQAGAAAGYLAVVEGYTDVLMAHQLGLPQVVATLGTALNARHVRQLRRFVPRVVLVYDADEGGDKGVNRALEIFVSQDVELAVAMLPQGLDPFDLLAQQGPEPFRQALENAVDALEFKLTRVLATGNGTGAPASIAASERALDELLRVIARAPERADRSAAVKYELMVTRIAQRLALREETVWARLRELRAEARTPPGAAPQPKPMGALSPCPR
jgi:DNA primase